MKRVFVVLMSLVSVFAQFMPPAAAEDPPVWTVQSAPEENGEVCVTFSLISLPKGSGLLYAQIELALLPGDYTVQKESFSWLPKDEGVLVTPQWNADNLLLLLEPETASFAGLDPQPLFSLRLQNDTGSETEPVFHIACILIDRAGQETLYTAEISGLTGEAVSPSGAESLSAAPEVSSPAEDGGDGYSLPGEGTGPAISGANPFLIALAACCLLATAAVILLVIRKKRQPGDGEANREGR